MVGLLWKIENEGVSPKPSTFNFLSFTFYCSYSYNTKVFVVKVKTDNNKLRLKIRNINDWIKGARTLDIKDIIKVLNLKLEGHYRYYGVTYNFNGIRKYYYNTLKLLYKWLNRRSQRRSFTLEQFYYKLNTEWFIKQPILYINLLNYEYS